MKSLSTTKKRRGKVLTASPRAMPVQSPLGLSMRGNTMLHTPEIMTYSKADEIKEFPPYINPDDVLALAIDLFVREPGLPNKLLDLCGSHSLGEKIPSLFHYLFVGTTHTALGTNDQIVSYRLRNPDERNHVNGT
jgi:hypothetical protein